MLPDPGIPTFYIALTMLLVELVFLWKIFSYARATYERVDALLDPQSDELDEFAGALADSMISNSVGGTIEGIVRGVRKGLKAEIDQDDDDVEPAPKKLKKKEAPKPAPALQAENGATKEPKTDLVKVTPNGST